MEKIFNELLSDTTKNIEKEMIDTYKGEYYDLFKSIFDDAENGIYIVDYDGNIVEMNNLFAEMFGYEKSELINEHYSLLISEDSRPVVNRNHYKIFNGINILKAEEKVRHKNGTYFYIQTSNLRVNDEFGNSLRITTAVDITARLKKELVQSVLLKISNLANLNINFEKLFPSIHDAVSELIPIKNFAVCVKNKRTGDIDIPYNLSEKNDNRTSLIKEHRYIEKERKATILDEYKIEKLVEEGILANYETIPKIFLGEIDLEDRGRHFREAHSSALGGKCEQTHAAVFPVGNSVPIC